MKLFRKSLSPEQFWEWLIKNVDDLRNMKSPNDKILKEFRKKLDAVHDGLAFEMGHFDEKTFHIIISAEGIRENFPFVYGLRNTAPPLPPGLKIDFFRQPESDVDCIEMGGIRLCKSDIYFRVHQRSQYEKFDLELFMPSHALTGLGKSMSFILLDKTIGEEFVVTRIGPIDWYDIADRPAGSELLEALYDVVIQKQKKHHFYSSACRDFTQRAFELTRNLAHGFVYDDHTFSCAINDYTFYECSSSETTHCGNVSL